MASDEQPMNDGINGGAVDEKFIAANT